MTIDKIGRIIWHDLFTKDLKRSMAFYEQVAGWNYVTEHATDFTWGGGEKDFVLALLDEEAGAGFTETPPEQTDGWIAYVEVRDVDITTALAEKLGGTIVRDAFEVPGVGRNALLRDPNGALFGVSISRHSFPAPTKQFGVELYASGTQAFPAEFYSELFDWTVDAESNALVAGPSGDVVAEISADTLSAGSDAVWIPRLNIADVEAALRRAEKAGAVARTSDSENQNLPAGIVFRDPAGAYAYLKSRTNV